MTEFKDFIGNPITEGCFCAYPGAGNVKAEYGMILYKIVGFDYVKKKVKAVRLFADYAQGQMYDTFHPSHTKNAIIGTVMIPDHYKRNEGKPIEGRLAVRYHISSLENTNKLAVVHPNERVQRIFNRVLELDSTVFEEFSPVEFSHWIHGGNVQNSFAS
jgi:hypothetical protein